MIGIKERIKRRLSKLYAVQQEFLEKNPIFDTRYLDKKIGDYALSIVKYPQSYAPINENNIAFLVTLLCDDGGHTELLKNLIQALPPTYKSKIFVTGKTRTEQNFVDKLTEIKQKSEISGVDFNWKKEKQSLGDLLKQILEFSPKKLITFLHMDDTFAVALLALIKKHTQIEIIFCNIGSHHSSLGMSFAHLIWEGMPSTAFVTQTYRGFKNTKVLGLCHLTKENLPVFTEQEVSKTKKELGIPENALCTMTGCASYKLFEQGRSLYLEMIQRILNENENIYHVLITRLDNEQKNTLKSLNISNRLIVVDFTSKFKLYFKCADLFIDSFPISSALTMIDLMSLKVPFVAFKNTNNLVFCFYEYLPENYDYLFDNVIEMQSGIEKLLNNKAEMKRVADANYAYYLENFEGSKVAQNVLNANSFDEFIQEEDYKNFKVIKLFPI